MSTGFERISRDSRLQDHWIRRVIAFVIDSIVVGVSTFFIGSIIWLPFAPMAMATGLPWYMFNPLFFPFFAGVLSVLYFAFLETYYGGTFGKRIMKLETTRLNGQKPPLDSAFIRNASKIYWALVLIDTIIGLASAEDPRQKATDRIAGTIVISAGSSPLRSDQKIQNSADFCAQCGERLPIEADYCPRCGKEHARN
jgi:uncharacterized RDD family membrane protein YckC